MNKYIFKIKSLLVILFLFFCNIFFVFNSYAENVKIGFDYGINKVAKNFNDLPTEISIENKDSLDFNGYITINVYENNKSVYVYKENISIKAKESFIYNQNISISNNYNTIIINVYNNKEELVSSERYSIDLSSFSEKLIIGVLSDNYDSLLYIDDLVLSDTSIQLKLVPLDIDKITKNQNYLDVIDMILVSEFDSLSAGRVIDDTIFNQLVAGKPVLIGLGGKYGIRTLPIFLRNYLVGGVTELNNITHFKFKNAKNIDVSSDGAYVQLLELENSAIVCSPYSFNSLYSLSNGKKKFIELLEKSIDKNWITKLSNYSSLNLNNDFYGVSNLLNIIDKVKLPDVFTITVLLLFYLLFLTIIIYVYLRNTNQREKYGKYVLIFSTIYTVIMFTIGYSVMKKNTFLTYISIVNVNNANAKEKAFLNFRTSERGDYSFNTEKRNKLFPLLKSSNEPIISLNFIDPDSIKTTTFISDEDNKIVTVQNTKDFDSNIFVYENSNYLNDIYNIDGYFERYDGEIVGRITNNMDWSLKNAHILLFGKILDLGDIEPNYSVSLSRAISVNAPINNNLMLSDILSDDINRNILKYYLDDNVFGYYDYGLLFGFIDNNMTIDIKSNDIGDVYGKTLIVTKINNISNNEYLDVCTLKNNINTIDGYYDMETNTINGDVEVINEYSLGSFDSILKIYFESMDSYDHGTLETFVPFYGDIGIFNYETNSYEAINTDTTIENDFEHFISSNNTIILKFSPISRDPLYRRICIPIIRTIVK